jgi:hypothetical protein
MRLAVSSIILAVGFATVVNAQEQSAAPAAASPPPAEAPAPEAAPPAPSLPTTGNGAEAIAVLEKICKPSVRGEKLDVLAKANGYKLNRREGTWTRQLGAEKGYSIILFPAGSNKGV